MNNNFNYKHNLKLEWMKKKPNVINIFLKTEKKKTRQTQKILKIYRNSIRLERPMKKLQKC